MQKIHRLNKKTLQNNSGKSRCAGKFGLSAVALAVIAYSAGLAAEEGDNLELPSIEVTGAEQKEDETRLSSQIMAPNDTAEYLRNLPGASVNQNGPLTGIAQYRGLYGERVNVLVGGTNIKPTCSNSMDPPLSHIPPALLESIELVRGIAPVSSGLETVGGSIFATPLSNDFSLSDEIENTGRVSAGYKSVSSGKQFGAFLGTANENHRLNASISAEQGDDYEYPDGEVSPSEYDRSTYGLGYGYRRGDYELDFGTHYNDTSNTGTPALPMDIVTSDAVDARVGLKVDLKEGRQFNARISGQSGEHEMDNFTLRTPPTMMMMPMKRVSNSEVDGIDFGMNVFLPSFDGQLQLGLDGDTAKHTATITDPTNAMWFVENFNEAEKNRTGLFAEWEGDTSEAFFVSMGARLTQVDMDSAEVDTHMGMAAGQLAVRFNNADRNQVNNNLDLVLNTTYSMSDTLALEAGVAQKTRSPSYQERYLWMPLESTGGLADGNSYIGDINLDPEVAHQLELGFNWDNKTAYISPRVFYHQIEDYIQGIPSTDSLANAAAMMMGKPAPLQYANVDAVLYGLDAPFGYQLDSSWNFDGHISYVRGKRDDISDNLYRIAPLNGSMALTYTISNWSLMGEVQGFAAQDKVSETNNETETSGYGLLNLRGSYRPTENVEIMAGIENLLDKGYAPHLGGFSRINEGELSKGDRLPGYGRNLFITAALEW